MADVMEIALRTAVAVVVLFLMTKLLGKRQVTQLSVFEYITGITIGSLAAYISLDLEANWYLGIVSLAVWVGISYAIEYVQLKSETVRAWVDGKAVVLVKEGKILEENLKKERLTAEEFLQQLRKNKVFNTADVEFALMEPNGEINVLLKPEHQPLTPKDLGIRLKPKREPQTVIIDGNVMDESLESLELTRQWLSAELKKQGLGVEDVFLAQVDGDGCLIIDRYKDGALNHPQPADLKAALLERLEQWSKELKQIGHSSEHEEVKRMYEQCSRQLRQMLETVR